MLLFWDTSAVVPLIFNEPHTPSARHARAAATRAFVWSWIRVEAEAALLRRNASPGDWENLARVLARMTWLETDTRELSALLGFNKPLGLRALDAGHLFVCSKAVSAFPGIHLVTFDQEMDQAARRCHLPVWTPP
jgi:predicted nucleic acid-binding protein